MNEVYNDDDDDDIQKILNQEMCDFFNAIIVTIGTDVDQNKPSC